MKKIILLGMVCSMRMASVTACNICGGGSGNYLGLLPQYQKHFVGLRYQFRGFETTHPPSLIPGMSGRKSIESYGSIELSGRYCPGKRWQILGILPYQFMRQVANGAAVSNQGIGDPLLMVYHSLIPGSMREGHKWRYLLQAGGGLKLPLGKHQQSSEIADYNPVLQPGSGSWDKMVSLIFSMRAKNGGLMVDASWTANGKNKFDYRFGNRFQATARTFYTLKRCDGTWMGSAGVYSENSQGDRHQEKYQSYTGGSLLMPMTSVEYFTEHIATGINIRVPAWQNLGDGYIKSNMRLLFNVSYLF